MLNRRSFLGSSLAIGSALAFPRRVLAQAWPSRPIRLIVPFPPGGGTDVVSRTLAERLRTLADVVAAAKAQGDLAMASAGNGTVGHLAGEMFARRAGIKFVHVPYKGAAPALTDVMGGSVAIFFASAGAVTGQVEGGR